jgi:hypothetical protein
MGLKGAAVLWPARERKRCVHCTLDLTGTTSRWRRFSIGADREQAFRAYEAATYGVYDVACATGRFGCRKRSAMGDDRLRRTRQSAALEESGSRVAPSFLRQGAPKNKMPDGCRRLMRSDWLYATGEKSYFKVNSLTSAKLDSTFFQIFFSPLGLSP